MPCAPNWSPERVRTRGDLLDSQADKSDPYTPSHGPYPRTVRGTGGPCPYASPAAKSRNFLPRARPTGGHGYGTTFSTPTLASPSLPCVQAGQIGLASVISTNQFSVLEDESALPTTLEPLHSTAASGLVDVCSTSSSLSSSLQVTSTI
jgi:hypothetical protein